MAKKHSKENKNLKSEIKRSKFDRSNLFNFESATIKDEELVVGKMPANKIHIVTLALFALFEAMVVLTGSFLVDYTLAQFITLSVVGLILARQIALDFAFHIMLEIYTFPLVIASIFVPFYVFGQGSITQSFFMGLMLFLFFLFFTVGLSKLLGKHAGIGGADIIFAFAMGGFLLPEVLFISIFLFTMLSLITTCFYDSKAEVPMGPGLLLSFWLCLLYQEQILMLLEQSFI